MVQAAGEENQTGQLQRNPLEEKRESFGMVSETSSSAEERLVIRTGGAAPERDLHSGGDASCAAALDSVPEREPARAIDDHFYQNCPVNNLIWRYVSFSCYRLTNELEEWYLYSSALCIATHHYYLFGRTNSLNLYIYLNHHSSS